MKADLTHAEACKAFDAFNASVGSKSYTSAGLNMSAYTASKGALQCFFRPQGSDHNKPLFTLYANSWRDLLACCEEAWAEHSDLHAANTIREMALAIIAITADQGECTDAALRAKFDAADVKRFGEQACAQATEMAANGPFSIVTLTGANDVGEAA